MRSHRFPKQRRTGMVLAIVLIGLLVITAFGAAMARSLISQNQHARRLERQQQTAWLAESGVQRAIHRLAKDAGYEGETWRIEGDGSGLGADAVVMIQVAAGSEPGGARRVTVEASYPSESSRRIAQWRELTLPLPVPEASE